MAITDLLPWRRSESKVPVRRGEVETDPFYAMQRDMNRLFDEFFSGGFGLRPFDWADESWSTFSPRVNVVESDKEISVSAELPGMDQKDIEVSYANGVLTLSGEKREEKEDKGKNYYRMERSFGSFRRSVQLPCEVEIDKAEATYKNGVLQVTLPKVVEGGECKRIPIHAG